jgi:ribosomal protein S5
MTILAVVALTAVGMGNGNITTGRGNSPRPQSTVHYPITFNSTNTVKVQRPQPTVSYPIRFSSRDGDQ